MGHISDDVAWRDRRPSIAKQNDCKSQYEKLENRLLKAQNQVTHEFCGGTPLFWQQVKTNVLCALLEEFPKDLICTADYHGAKKRAYSKYT